MGNTSFKACLQLSTYKYLLSGGLIFLVASSTLCALSLAASDGWFHLLIISSILLQTLVGLIFMLAALLLVRVLSEKLSKESEKKEKAEALNSRFQRLLDSATHIAVITTDNTGRITSFSEGAKEIFGFSSAEILDKNFVQALNLQRWCAQGYTQLEKENELSIDQINEGCNDGAIVENKSLWSFKRRDGSLIVGELRMASSFNAQGVLEEYLGVVIDVTIREETYQTLKQSKTFLKLVTQRVPSMLYQYQMKSFGKDGRFTYCSEGVQRVFGLLPKDVVGLSYADSPLFKRVYPPDMEKIIAATASSMEETGASYCDFRLLQPDNSLRWVRGDFYTERQSDASYVWYGSCTDINELKAREEAFRKQAITDELTGIYNRRYFMESLSRLIAQARRHAVEVSLIMIDLDHFKQINDKWGHETGDHVLRQACDLIRDRIRITDIFCRVGGEEFAILCPHTDGPNAAYLAEQLRQNLANLPIAVVGSVTASFGVGSWVDDESENELLRKADFATYRAKAGGRNRVELSPK